MQYHSLEGVLVIRCSTNTLLGVQRVGIYVEIHGEFPSCVYLFIFKLIVIEAHSLKMDDEIVGNLCQEGAFSYIGLLLAGIALIVRDDLSIYELLERFFDVFVSFNFQRKGIEWLESFVDCFAV